MKFITDFTDTFMNPQDGTLLLSSFPSLQKNYTFLGNNSNQAFASPILIDIRLELIRLKSLLGTTRFILQSKIAELYNAQALDQLTTGFLYNTDGILSIQTPGSGNLSLQEGYVYVGDSNNLAVGQPTINFDNLPDLLNKQIIIGNSSDRPEARTTFYYDNFPDLQYKNLIVGDVSNRPIQTLTVFIDNLPNLTNQKIWRGNSLNRPEESDALTNTENSLSQTIQDLANLASIVSAISDAVNALTSTVDAIETGIASIGGFAAILLLQVQVLGLIGAVASLSSRVSDVEGDVSVIQGQITDIYNNITALNTRIDNLRLNNILADADVSFYGFKLINLADPVSPTDGVNLRTMQAAIDGIPGSIIITLQGAVSGSGPSNQPIITTFNLTLNQIANAGNIDISNYRIINLADPLSPQDAVNLRTLQSTIGNITLDGFVLGTSDINGLIHTTRGPDCLLTNIPAGGDVSLDNFRITNLGDYEADNDALSIQGFWDLIHNPDLYVARINPELAIIGNVQQFSFNQNRSVFQIENTFTPTNLIPSENIEEFRNSNNSGYRLVQETSSTSNSGEFYLEKFLNGEEDGEKILSFEESTDQLTLEKILNANNQRIVNVTEEPAADQDAISFIYLWRVLNDEVF